MERFNLKKLNEVEGEEQYRVEIWNRFAALENLDAEVDIDGAWETVTPKRVLSYCEMKKHKSWFDERCSELLDQRK
jgi:hypothetical protein